MNATFVGSQPPPSMDVLQSYLLHLVTELGASVHTQTLAHLNNGQPWPPLLDVPFLQYAGLAANANASSLSLTDLGTAPPAYIIRLLFQASDIQAAQAARALYAEALAANSTWLDGLSEAAIISSASMEEAID